MTEETPARTRKTARFDLLHESTMFGMALTSELMLSSIRTMTALMETPRHKAAAPVVAAGQPLMPDTVGSSALPEMNLNPLYVQPGSFTAWYHRASILRWLAAHPDHAAAQTWAAADQLMQGFLRGLGKHPDQRKRA